MDVKGEYVFDAPQELVWQALQDSDVLGSIMPGGQDFERTGENEYAGLLNIKVGPVQGKFKGTIELSDLVAPESYKMTVDGKGAPGFVKASGEMKLTPEGDRTHMAYEGTAMIGGRIASVGQRLLDASARSIIRQSLEALNEYLKVQMAALAVAEASGGSEEEVAEAVANVVMPEYSAPAQSTVALNVAKDVAAELIPPERRPLVVAAVLVLLILLFFRARR